MPKNQLPARAGTCPSVALLEETIFVKTYPFTRPEATCDASYNK